MPGSPLRGSFFLFKIDRAVGRLYLETIMEMPFTPDQAAFVREAIAEGRLHDEQEAVCAAMALWEERERLRAEILA